MCRVIHAQLITLRISGDGGGFCCCGCPTDLYIYKRAISRNPDYLLLYSMEVWFGRKTARKDHLASLAKLLYESQVGLGTYPLERTLAN
jgi:hypothetical protein